MENKIYYKLSDIAKKLEVDKYTLKYWEDNFRLFKPVKVGSRLNLYTAQDFELFRVIQRLIHVERYTLEGARMRLVELGLAPRPAGASPASGKSRRGPRSAPEPPTGAFGPVEAPEPEPDSDPDSDPDSAPDSDPDSDSDSGPDPLGAPFEAADSGFPFKPSPLSPSRLNWSEGLSDLLGEGSDPRIAPDPLVAGPPEPPAVPGPVIALSPAPSEASDTEPALRRLVAEVRQELLAIRGLLDRGGR